LEKTIYHCRANRFIQVEQQPENKEVDVPKVAASKEVKRPQKRSYGITLRLLKQEFDSAIKSQE